MYLNKAKERYEFLQRLDSERYQSPVSCSSEHILSLQKSLGLKLPDAYVEFLSWAGESLDVFRGHMYQCGFVEFSNKESALDIMKDYNSSEVLPDDAIIFFVRQGGYAFGFIRSSEGINPPVHYFDFVKATESDEPGARIIWNYAATLDDFCLMRIEHPINIYLAEQRRQAEKGHYPGLK
jgi:hypothetical protein